MLYVQQSLSPGEELIHMGYFHWIYTLQAIMCIIWGVLGASFVVACAVYATPYINRTDITSQPLLTTIQQLHPGIRIGAFGVLLLGLIRFSQMMMVRGTTEIAITSARLIYKRGLVARYIGEMSIDRIESVNLLQTAPGRLFGYGRLMVRGMGVGEVILPPIENPVAFRRAIEVAKTHDEKTDD